MESEKIKAEMLERTSGVARDSGALIGHTTAAVLPTNLRTAVHEGQVLFHPSRARAWQVGVSAFGRAHGHPFVPLHLTSDCTSLAILHLARVPLYKLCSGTYDEVASMSSTQTIELDGVSQLQQRVQRPPARTTLLVHAFQQAVTLEVRESQTLLLASTSLILLRSQGTRVSQLALNSG